MPMILNQVSVAAGAVNNNLVSGSAFEFARVQSIYSIGLMAGNVGAFCTLQGGSDIIAEEFPLPTNAIAANSPNAVAMTTTNSYPNVPDQMYFTDILNPGDRLVIRVRNPTGGAIVVNLVVQISPTGN